MSRGIQNMSVVNSPIRGPSPHQDYIMLFALTQHGGIYFWSRRMAFSCSAGKAFCCWSWILHRCLRRVWLWCDRGTAVAAVQMASLILLSGIVPEDPEELVPIVMACSYGTMLGGVEYCDNESVVSVINSEYVTAHGNRAQSTHKIFRFFSYKRVAKSPLNIMMQSVLF